MNKAITDGVQLMPPAFVDGLSLWSRGDGTPGSDTYEGFASAAFVPADQDFGGCLEVQKTETVQKLRYMGETPLLPGCYLRITARVKAISGNLPSVRIAGWAGAAGGGHVDAVTETGPARNLTSYGEVIEVSAIVGAGLRNGVDMVWGTQAIFGHFGLDLTGANGGVVRIDDIVIEDITSVFHRDMMNWVDVRDFGALGDGSTDDSAAFEAADAAANGRKVLVSAGVYRLANDVTINNRIEFEGMVTMPDNRILSLTKDFGLPAYIDAFGDEELAFKKAFQSLFNNSDHVDLDLGGRRVSLFAPVDMQAAVGNRTSFAQRRVIRNGQLRAELSGDWAPDTFSSQATYSAASPYRLSNVVNVANIPTGSLVQGAGVGREVYVRYKNVAAQEITLSAPLSDAEGTQNYTFTRFKYLIDLSGFEKLDLLGFTDVEFQCQEAASGVLLAPLGKVMEFTSCSFNKPGDRAITSMGDGCQGMLVDKCVFSTSDGTMAPQDRTRVAINSNANDLKVRNCRASYFRHFLVLGGAQNVVSGNHFFQGGPGSNVRTAGIVLNRRSCNTTITANYVDNCFVEWGNEYEPDRDFTGGFGFAGLTINGNIFLASEVAPWFTFIQVKPYGTGHFLNGVNVAGNTFRCVQAQIDRAESVDESFAPLDLGRMKNVLFTGNTYHNVVKDTQNPLLVTHTQNTAAVTWALDGGGELPFEGEVQNASGLVLRSPIRNGGGALQYVTPTLATRAGANRTELHLRWPEAMTGTVSVELRMDDI